MSGKLAELAVEQAIKLFLKSMLKGGGEFTPTWTKGVVVYYGPHIKVLTNILMAELQDATLAENLRELRNALTKYATELDAYRGDAGAVPSPGQRVDGRAHELVALLDGLLGGTLELLRRVAKCVAEANERLENDKSRDAFQLVFGYGKVVTVRNDACCAAKELVVATERLLKYRNEWAAAAGVPVIGPNIRRKVEEPCPESVFFY